MKSLRQFTVITGWSGRANVRRNRRKNTGFYTKMIELAGLIMHGRQTPFLGEKIHFSPRYHGMGAIDRQSVRAAKPGQVIHPAEERPDLTTGHRQHQNNDLVLRYSTCALLNGYLRS